MNLEDRKAYIERSRERCISYGISEDTVFSMRIVEGMDLQDRLNRKKELIVTAAPFIHQLYDFVKGSNFFAILTDEEGCILSLVGDEDILRVAHGLKMVPGAFMDEHSIGTNAMGTALVEGIPVQVSGKEHFIKTYHRWTCSCAVIRDPEGNVIGSLDLTGHIENVHPHTLGMVVAAANAIEKSLRLNRKNEALENNKKFIETLMDSIQSGIISCELDGSIKTVNTQALQMFGHSRDEMINMNITNLFNRWQDVRQACLSKKEFQNEDVLVNSRCNKLYYNTSAYPVISDQQEVGAIILLFSDIKKVRKQANEIMGRKAIYTFDKIMGQSPALQEAINFAKRVSSSRSTVLITGESGTGKEIFAHAIQNHSERRNENFIVVNCASIPRNLIESELFGYEEGAFTGAKRGGQPGKFEIADGGTIFLDEIGEMPLDMQTRLLRVIQEGTVNRVGSNREIPVDVRIIAATNKDLKEEVSKGNFRMDLYYRLNVLPVKLPALRERKEDIPLLIDYFTGKICKKINKRPVTISQEYMDLMLAYDWPGNIRELENRIELIINSEHVPIELQKAELKVAHEVSLAAAPCTEKIMKEPMLISLEELESRHIKSVLSHQSHNVTLAAKILGVGRNTLYRKMSKYQIECSEDDGCSEKQSCSEVEQRSKTEH